MSKHTRSIFVIMPFEASPTRDKHALDHFFEYCLKRPIEASDDFIYAYRVHRSGNTFDINDQIIHDLQNADIVLCDLSGEHANPNVMYELGVRLAISHKPVIMIREDHPANKRIFDVGHYYTHPYTPISGYAPLERHIKDKLKALEHGDEVFRSPVLTTLGRDPAVIAEIEKQRVVSQLKGLCKSLNSILRAAGGSLVMYLEDVHATPLPPETIHDLPQYLVDHKAMLKGLDWHRYNFRPALPPQLHALLSDNRLEATCEEWVAQLWLEIFGEYYGHFFGTDLYWSDSDYVSMVSFVGQTHHIFAGIAGLIGLIEASNDDDRRIAQCSMLKPLVRIAGLPQPLHRHILDVVNIECGGP